MDATLFLFPLPSLFLCKEPSILVFLRDLREREKKERKKDKKWRVWVVWLPRLRRKKDLLFNQAPQHLAFLLFSFLSFSLLDQSALLPSLMSATHMTAPIKKRRRTEPEETEGGGVGKTPCVMEKRGAS